MANDDNYNYVGVLLADIQAKLQGVAEAVGDLNNKANETTKRLDKIEENTNLIPAVQLAVN